MGLDNGIVLWVKSENWYNPYYSIMQTLSEEEIKNMSDEQVEKLMALANYC